MVQWLTSKDFWRGELLKLFFQDVCVRILIAALSKN